MRRRRLGDEEIGAALLRGGGAQEPCALQDQLWDLARGALDPDEARRIVDHSVDCPDCNLALRVARELFLASALPLERSAPPSFLAALWARLVRSVLGPVPALAYLALLVLSFPLYRFLSESPSVPIPVPPSASSGLRALRVVPLTGDLSLRGGGAPAAPLAVRLEDAEALVLKVFPDLEDLPEGPRAAVLVRVLDGETVIAEMTRPVAEIDRDESFSLLLDRALLRPGSDYRVELTAAGTAASPSPILRQSFRLHSP